MGGDAKGSARARNPSSRSKDQLTAAQNVVRSVTTRKSDRVFKALCRTTDPDELFVRGAAQRKAAVIRHRPVMQECAADALDNKVEFGVWGGNDRAPAQGSLAATSRGFQMDYPEKRKRRTGTAG